MTVNAPVAQLDRVLGYEPNGREFESLRVHQKKAHADAWAFFLHTADSTLDIVRLRKN